jgi:hypothetical protein
MKPANENDATGNCDVYRIRFCCVVVAGLISAVFVWVYSFSEYFHVTAQGMPPSVAASFLRHYSLIGLLLPISIWVSGVLALRWQKVRCIEWVVWGGMVVSISWIVLCLAVWALCFVPVTTTPLAR